MKGERPKTTTTTSTENERPTPSMGTKGVASTGASTAAATATTAAINVVDYAGSLCNAHMSVLIPTLSGIIMKPSDEEGGTLACHTQHPLPRDNTHQLQTDTDRKGGAMV